VVAGVWISLPIAHILVRSSIRGNVTAAESRCLSQVKKRYVISTRGWSNIRREHEQWSDWLFIGKTESD
jgi:hypothetical protein